MDEKKTKLQKVIDTVKNFERVRSEVGLGASDSEPDYMFQYLLWNAVKGEPWHTPTQVDWELYDQIGVGVAVRRLNSAAYKCYRTIQSASIAESPPIVDYLEDYTWRITK